MSNYLTTAIKVIERARSSTVCRHLQVSFHNIYLLGIVLLKIVSQVVRFLNETKARYLKMILLTL